MVDEGPDYQEIVESVCSILLPWRIFTIPHRIEDNKEGTSILENGWIRYAFPPTYLFLIKITNNCSVNSANVVVEYRRRIYSDNFCSRGWLAQANHIFNSLDITSNFEKYGEFQLHGNW
jgi:hypothetical protein